MSDSPFIYERIGRTYAATRHADPRISAHIDRALAGAKSVVNVGAGTGSYEPPSRSVIAVEPSSVMIEQRPNGSFPVVQAAAEALPFREGSFDAAMAILTMHHWSNPLSGAEELKRVARRVVVLTIDPAYATTFWLTADYFPAIGEWDAQHFPSIGALCSVLGEAVVTPVPIPHDCQDGFLAGHWRTPSDYLDPRVRAGISTFSLISETARLEGLRHLDDDIASGAWAERHSPLLELEELDLGYRLVVAALPS